MSTLRKLIFTMLIFFVLVACVKNERSLVDKQIKLDQKNEILQSHTDFKYLESYGSIVESSTKFDKVKAFEPNKSQLKTYEGVQEDYKYIRLKTNENYIKGKVIVENKSSEDLITENIFYQGGDKIDIKLSDGKKYNKVITVTPPGNVTELDVYLDYSKEGNQELTFFPKNINQEDPLDGQNLQLVRYFVTSKDVDESNKILENYEVKVDEKDLGNYDQIPIVDVLDENNNVIRSPTANKISMLRVNMTFYSSILDIYIVDNDGVVLYEKVNVETIKKEDIIIELPKNVIEEINKRETYLLYYNNRSEELIYDFISADRGYRPFLTSFQNIQRLN